MQAAIRDRDQPENGSQGGSQRAPSMSHVRRCQAIVVAGDGLPGRHRATAGDRKGLIWEQEAAGSNPAIPTRSERCGSRINVWLMASRMWSGALWRRHGRVDRRVAACTRRAGPRQRRADQAP
jgi:hypothetical protein